jgi:hypothetical protein
MKKESLSKRYPRFFKAFYPFLAEGLFVSSLHFFKQWLFAFMVNASAHTHDRTSLLPLFSGLYAAPSSRIRDMPLFQNL